jgi:hypothetical protein
MFRIFAGMKSTTYRYDGLNDERGSFTVRVNKRRWLSLKKKHKNMSAWVEEQMNREKL